MNQAQLGIGGVDIMRRAGSPRDWTPDEPPNLDGITEVGFDLETTGLRWWAGDRPVGVALAFLRGGRLEQYYLPFGHRGGGNLDETRVLDYCRRELSGKHLFALNAPFDIHHSQEWGLDLEAIGCRVGDVGHRAALLDDSRRSFSLESIAQDVLGEGKVKGLAGDQIANYAAWQVADYARQDAGLVIRILEAQKPLLAAEKLGRVVALEDDVIFPTVEMERNAALIDVEKLRRWVRETEKEEVLAALRVTQAAGYQVDPNSSEDMARLFHDRKITTERVTPGGKKSFAADVVTAAAESDEVVALVQRLSRLMDLRVKFLLPYNRTVGDDGILRFALHQLKGDEYGTVSGRFSASTVSGPDFREGFNIQQVMAVTNQLRLYCSECRAEWAEYKDAARVQRHYASHPQCYLIRELHIPAPGKVLYSADAKQVEYRIFASLTGSQRLIEIYKNDPETDFHDLVTEMVQKFRRDMERKRVKNVNFCKLFGGGISKIALMIGISEDDAREFVRLYDRAFPEAAALMKRATNRAERNGFVRTVTGRRARFKTRVRTYSALNRVIQGSAADEAKTKAVMLHRARKRLGIKPRFMVHDEFVGDAESADAAPEMKKLLEEQILEFNVPILWDVKTAITWSGGR